MERQPAENGQYIDNGLSVWLDCNDLIANTWIDKIQNLPFTIKNADEYISTNGVFFTGENETKIYSDSIPILMGNGFTVEIRIHDFNPIGRNAGRILCTANSNIYNSPNLCYFNNWNTLFGFGVQTWGNMRFSSGIKENFPQSFTIAMSEDSVGNTSIYNNGDLIASGIIQPPTMAKIICIGGWPMESSKDEQISGLIKSLRLYDRILEEDEIKMNYQTDITLFGG